MDNNFNMDLQEALLWPQGLSESSIGKPKSIHVQPKHSDVYVAVMGVTGSGKSTFISHCTEVPVEIGHAMESCKMHPFIPGCT